MVEKFEKKVIEGEVEKKCDCLILFLIILCSVLFILLIGATFLLFNCDGTKSCFRVRHHYFGEKPDERKIEPVFDDEDDIKVQLYLLESNFYLDEIDKEETKLTSISKDYQMAARYALKRNPDCVRQFIPHDLMQEYQNIEILADNSIKYFKQILMNWNDNIDYMDIDKTLMYLLKQYQDIYFNPGDWKEEKIDRRWQQLKDFYGNAINEIEKCTIPFNITQDNFDKYQNIKEQIEITENELEEKLNKLNQINEELIKKVNVILHIKTQCLHDFPEKWALIQTEETTAEREIHVIKFKLKQIKYKLMIADTTEKFDNLVKWENNFTKTKIDRYKYFIDNHYENALKIQIDLLQQINKCSLT